MSKVLSFISDAEIETTIESITIADVHRIIKLADRILSLSINDGPHHECMMELDAQLLGDSEIIRTAGYISHPHEPDEMGSADTFGSMIVAATLLAARQKRKGKSVRTHRMMRRKRSLSVSKARV